MEDIIAELVDKIAQEEGIQDHELEIHSTDTKGDGYLGVIRFGKIIGSNKTLDLVFKCRHPNQEFLPELVSKIYQNEIAFYEVIVPAFVEFQKEYNVSEPFDNTPEMYGALKETFKESFAMKNLKVDSYVMWGRQQLMNAEHLKCALKTFAKFHGISLAMQQLKPDLYEVLSSKLQPDIFRQAFEDINMYSQTSKVANDVKEMFNEDTDSRYSEALKNYAKHIRQRIDDSFDYDKHYVIIQGDCWCANALYKYDESSNEKPADMKLLDFQMVKLGSPVLDLSYFFYAAAPRIHLDALDDFLKFYHEELKKHLAKFGLNEDIFSFEDLLDHWQCVSIFGFGMALMVKKVMLIESQDAPDLTDGASDFYDRMVMTPETEALYREQARDLVEHCVDRNLIY